MADLLRLLFLVPLGFIGAVIAATLTIVAGWYGHQAGDVVANAEATGFVLTVAFLVMVRVGALAVLPAVLAIALAEMFRWRSLFFYLAVGGALGLLVDTLHGIQWATVDDRLLLPAAGFVGGLAYWLIAGRLAGGSISEPPPADRSQG